MRPVMARLARWDRDTADRADRYVAISHYVAGRIGRYYNREATVVYPPVDTDFFHPDGGTRPSGYALVVSALVPYKRIDVAIDACRLAGVPLKIVGDGPERAALERRARRAHGASFSAALPTTRSATLYRRAAVVLLPGEEDFGIVPLEAQACGRPVVALGRGGALETVVHGETGLLVDDPAAEAFADAHRDARSIARSIRPPSAATPSGSAASGSATRSKRARSLRSRHAMVNRHNRLLVAFHVLSDSLLGAVARSSSPTRSGSTPA